MCPSKRSLVVVLGLTVAASPMLSLAQQPDTVPAPMTLLRHAPGEPSWAATIRLRDAESRYAHHPQWSSTYCQLRGQSEVWLGDHAAALRQFESCGWSWGDSSYVVPSGMRATDAVLAIAAAADTARIVMVNERHHAASDRLLTLRLLSVLRQKGYTYFAAEAFDWADTGLNHRAAAKAGVTGGYVDEPVFGEIVREARRLGYTLVPYEATPEQNAAKDSLNQQQRRDYAQARNLNDRIFRADPNAKVLVHAGFAHVQERPTDTWFPMAWYLRQLTGLDPVTVDQTVMAEASTAAHEHPAYRAAYAAGLIRGSAVVLTDTTGRPLPAVRFNAVDMQVATPRTTYTRGRPDWMTLGERRRAVDVAVSECATRACVLEVRMSDDPNDAVPIDRTEAREATARLFLPLAGRVRVQVFAPTGEILRTFEPSGDR
jgi:hypothetical protein